MVDCIILNIIKIISNIPVLQVDKETHQTDRRVVYFPRGPFDTNVSIEVLKWNRDYGLIVPKPVASIEPHTDVNHLTIKRLCGTTYDPSKAFEYTANVVRKVVAKQLRRYTHVR